MKSIFYITILGVHLSCFAQTETKEDFINEVKKNIPYFSDRKPNLCDTATGWYGFDFVDSMLILQAEIRNNIPDTIMKQILSNSTKSVSEKWHAIHDVKIVHCEAKKYRRLLRGRLMYKHSTYFISNVVFDNKHNFAMVRIGYNCGITCGESCVYFFTKVNSKWSLLTKSGCIVI